MRSRVLVSAAGVPVILLLILWPPCGLWLAPWRPWPPSVVGS